MNRCHLPLRSSSFLAATALLLAFGPREAHAVCVSFPVCEQYWMSDAVFVGTVTDIRCGVGPDDPEGPAGDEVHFAVDEAFRGVTGGTAVVREWVCGGVVRSESVEFRKGETYFVQAFRGSRSDPLQTSLCSTQPIGKAGPALEYARWIRSGPRAGRVSGHVVHVEWDPENDGMRSFGLPSDLVVTLQGGDIARRVAPVMTGLVPTFVFEGVPPGSYSVNVEMSGPYAIQAPVAVTIRRPHLCAEVDFELQWKGVVRGRVLDAEGRPVPHCAVAVAGHQRAAAEHRRTELMLTNEDGEFVHDRLGPGDYAVGIHIDSDARGRGDTPHYFPGVHDARLAQVVSVTIGSETDLGDLHLPMRVDKVALEGHVVRPDGSPAVDAQVRFQSEEQSFDPSEMTTRTGANGLFRMFGVRGRRYRISATLVDEGTLLGGEAQVVAGELVPIEIGVRRD